MQLSGQTDEVRPAETIEVVLEGIPQVRQALCSSASVRTQGNSLGGSEVVEGVVEGQQKQVRVVKLYAMLV